MASKLAINLYYAMNFYINRPFLQGSNFWWYNVSGSPPCNFLRATITFFFQFTHKPVWFLKGNNPVLLRVNMYKFFHIYVQGEATSFISSTTILKLLLAGILMSEIVMRKLDLTVGMILQKSGRLASLHSDWLKLYIILTFLCAIGLSKISQQFLLFRKVLLLRIKAFYSTCDPEPEPCSW